MVQPNQNPPPCSASHERLEHFARTLILSTTSNFIIQGPRTFYPLAHNAASSPSLIATQISEALCTLREKMAARTTVPRSRKPGATATPATDAANAKPTDYLCTKTSRVRRLA